MGDSISASGESRDEAASHPEKSDQVVPKEIVQVVMMPSGDFEQDQEYLETFHRISIEHIGVVALHLIIRDGEGAVTLRWKLGVTPSQEFFDLVRNLAETERAEIR